MCLELPEYLTSYTDVSYSIVDQKAAQIQFYDTKPELNAVAGAWRAEEGLINNDLTTLKQVVLTSVEIARQSALQMKMNLQIQ